MSFQKCPICNGRGGTPGPCRYPETAEEYLIQCSTCSGMKIINSETGLPPAKDMVTTVGGSPVADEKPEDIISPLSVLDDLSDEEILFWSTPYGHELEKIKEEKKKQLEDPRSEN